MGQYEKKQYVDLTLNYIKRREIFQYLYERNIHCIGVDNPVGKYLVDNTECRNLINKWKIMKENTNINRDKLAEYLNKNTTNCTTYLGKNPPLINVELCKLIIKRWEKLNDIKDDEKNYNNCYKKNGYSNKF